MCYRHLVLGPHTQGSAAVARNWPICASAWSSRPFCQTRFPTPCLWSDCPKRRTPEYYFTAVFSQHQIKANLDAIRSNKWKNKNIATCRHAFKSSGSRSKRASTKHLRPPSLARKRLRWLPSLFIFKKQKVYSWLELKTVGFTTPNKSQLLLYQQN